MTRKRSTRYAVCLVYVEHMNRDLIRIGIRMAAHNDSFVVIFVVELITIDSNRSANTFGLICDSLVLVKTSLKKNHKTNRMQTTGSSVLKLLFFHSLRKNQRYYAVGNSSQQQQK